MSLNRNILNKKYYIVIPYFSEELGQNDFDKDDADNIEYNAHNMEVAMELCV